MKPIAISTRHHEQVVADDRHLASAMGNTGVDVVSSPATIGFIEMACLRLMQAAFEGDEASVGVGFSFRHLAAARPGEPIDVAVELIAIDGRKYTFECVVTQNGVDIMTGRHERFVVNLGRFLK